MKSSKLICAVFAFQSLAVLPVRAATVYTGDTAVTKIKEVIYGLSSSDLSITSSKAKWSTPMTGVDMGFMSGTLFGNKDEVNIVRINTKTAKLKMKYVYGSSLKKTSEAAYDNGALIAVSGPSYNPDQVKHTYWTKVNGTVLSSVNASGSGLVFNTDDPYRLFHVTYNLQKNWVNEHWDNAISAECVMIDGEYAASETGTSTSTSSSSPGFPVFGFNEKTGYIYIFLVDGYRSGSWGITYYGAYKLLKACGCTGGFVCDGGGSSTLTLKDSIVPSSDFSPNQYTPSGVSGYKNMNYTIADHSTKSERQVLSQFLFVSADAAATPIPDGAYFDGMSSSGDGSNRGQRLELDYRPNADTAIDAVYSLPVAPAADVDQCFWSARSATSDAGQFSLFTAISGGKGRFDYGELQNGLGSVLEKNTQNMYPYRLSVRGNVYTNLNVDTGKAQKTYTAKRTDDFTAGSDLALFQGRPKPDRSGWGESATLTLNRFRVADKVDGSEVVRHDLYGSYRDGKNGFYDTISGTFYPSTGSATNFERDDWRLIRPGSTLTVVGEPFCFPCDALGVEYGARHWLKSGNKISVTRPTALQYSANGQMRASLVSWSLTQGGSTKKKETAFTYTHDGADAQLVANWLVACNLQVKSLDTALGTVNTSGGWQEYDASVTLTATPKAGQSFLRWKGDIDGVADPTLMTISVKMDRPRVIWADFGPRWTEWTTFPAGAFVDTGIIPTDHETRVRFSCDYAAGRYVFGTSKAETYYSFSMYNNYWRWGLNGTSHTSESVFGSKTEKGKWSAGEHEVVYRQNGTGNLIVDGETYESVTPATSSTSLLLGKGYYANFSGKVMDFKVLDGSGQMLLKLKPCIRTDEDGHEIPALYDLVSGKYFTSDAAAYPLAAGVLSSERVLVDGTPFRAGEAEGLVDYAPRDGVKAGDTVKLTAPQYVYFGPTVGDKGGTRAQCTGWRRYRRDIPNETETLVDSGTGLTVSFQHDGLPCRVEWQWTIAYNLDVKPLDDTMGSVSVAGGWKQENQSITLTATPATGHRFYGWLGDIGDADRTNPTINITMDQGRTVRADFGPRWTEWTEFPAGAYVDTGIIPTDHETRIRFSCDYLNAGYVFSTGSGANYYGLSMSSGYWRWGLDNASRTAVNVFGTGTEKGKWTEDEHTFVYRENGTGNLIVDGEVYEAVSAATSPKSIMLGKGSTTANFTGKVMDFKVRDGSGQPCVNLKPCLRINLDGTETPAFFDLVSGEYVTSAAAAVPFAAGKVSSKRILVDGFPFKAGLEDGYVSYAPMDDVATGATKKMSVPVQFWLDGGKTQVTCVGWKLYRRNIADETETLVKEGDLNFATITHEGLPARLEWQWKIEYYLDAESLDATAGFVTPGVGEYYEAGAVVSIKATPKEDRSFFGWLGDIGDADPSNQTIKLTMDRPRKIWADFGPLWTEWTEFPKGAYVATGITPANHETTIRFSCDYLNAGYVFATSKAESYYGFSMYNNYWRWGLNGSYRTAESVFGKGTEKGKWSDGEHTVVYCQNGTGDVIVDGETLDSVETAVSTTELWIGRGYTYAANFTGKVSRFKVRDAQGNLVRDLQSCLRITTDDELVPAFYDFVSKDYFISASATALQAGKQSNKRILVNGYPFNAGEAEGTVSYKTKDDVLTGAKVSLGVPPQFTFGGGRIRATCLGCKRYRRDIANETERLLDVSNGVCSITFKHDGYPTRVEWQWKIEYLLDAKALDGSKGSVTAVNGWYEAGAEVVVTAQQKDGERFFGWLGDTDGASAGGQQMTVTMDRPRTVRADFGPEFLEYAEFPYGAYVTTDIVPTNCETRVVFAGDCPNNGYLFGTAQGTAYYGVSVFNFSGAYYWRWGLAKEERYGRTAVGTNVARSNGIDGRREVVFRERGTGNLILDGEVLDDVSAATSTKALVLGHAPGTATDLAGVCRIYSFAVAMKRGMWSDVLDLRPCVRTLLDGTKSVQFYDRVNRKYYENGAVGKDLVAGPFLKDRLVVTGEPYDVSGAGETGALSVPAEIPFGDWAKATCTGWKRYRYDPYQDKWSQQATGTGTSVDYVPDGFPTKIAWQWTLTQLKPGTYSYVHPGGSDSNDGTSWAKARRTVQAAVDAAAAGATVLVAPGHYFGTETKFNDKVDYLTCIRLAKRVSVIGIGGRERTLMDGGFVYPRNGAYVTADGAFLAGFTFTNTAWTAAGRNLGVDLTAGTVSNVSFHARAVSAPSFLNINATVGRVLATDVLLPPQPLLAGNVNGSTYVNATGAMGATIDRLTLRDWTIGGVSAAASMINLKGSSATAPIVLRNALVADNLMGLDVNANRGNIVYADAYSRVINCTIVNNEVRGPNAALRVAATSALVENCIIRGNRSVTGTYGDIYNNANVGCVYTTLCDQLDPAMRGNLNGNPNFRDESNGDYRLMGGSKAVDAGGEKGGDTTLFGTADLDGAARVVGAAVDLGCYEHQATSDLEVGFEASEEVSEPGHALAITFTGRVSGGSGDVTAVWDFGDGTTATDWPAVEHSYAAPGSYTVTLSVTRGGKKASYTLEGLVRVIPSACYVKVGGGAGTWPYDTLEKATDDIVAALAVGSSKVLVAPGTYTLPLPCVTVDHAVELKSMEGPEVTILDSPKTVTDCVHRHFTVCHAKAVVSGFTLTGGYSSSTILAGYAAVLDISAGQVENCVIRDSGRLSAGQIVNLSGTGKLVDCELDGNGLEVHNSAYNGTAAIYLTGYALADRCWVHGYRIPGFFNNTANYTPMAPVVVNSANAALRNSLVTHCTNSTDGVTADDKHSGIVQIFNGKVENCTIADNLVGGRGAVVFARSGGGVTKANGTLVNTIVSRNVALTGEPGVWNPLEGDPVSSCYTGDAPGFSTSSSDPPYMPSQTSPCVDKGEELAWTDTGSDFAGNPRKVNKVDIGCYERNSPANRFPVEVVSADGSATNFYAAALAEDVVRIVAEAAYGERVVIGEKFKKSTEFTLAPGVEVVFAAEQNPARILFANVPANYLTPSVKNLTARLELDSAKVTPVLADGEGAPAFAVADGLAVLNCANVQGGLRYTLETAEQPVGPWSPVTFKFGTAGEDIAFEAKATGPCAFYRIVVSDQP